MKLTKSQLRQIISEELSKKIARSDVENVDEVAYNGNMGFHEMFLFYNKADNKDVNKLESLIKRKKFKEAWKLVQDVTGITLK